ncbi:MAG: hypothetical protein E6R13_06890 [Spirochaetes bacterium]|nr:MAG: hypothetical protein E6R13_06890 [Spirochaetota bacterium]
MAIRTGYQPARLPQNQQWFQLPLDKMYTILSDAQTKADLARGEVDALSSQTFANLPQDAAAAEQAKLWLKDSADKLVEQYGEDPRAWGAGLTKLKKEIAYRFDPNTGDIGAMQSRVDNFKAYQTKLQEQYKDYPELANYAVSNIKVDPLEASMGDKVSFGVTPPAMKRNVEEKEITDFIDKTLGNIMADTYQIYGLQEYSSLDEFTKAFASGTMTGIAQKKVIEALTTQIPEEYLYSYQQKALARGATPEQAAQELQVVNPDNTLNENSTMGLKVLGASYGKAYGQENITYKFIQDKAAIERAKAAQDKINKTLIPWNVSTSAYSYDAPWGKTVESINTYIKGLDQSIVDVKNGILTDLGFSEEDKKVISPENLMNAKRSTAADGRSTVWNYTDANGQERTLAMSDGVMDNFKRTYTSTAISKAIAEQTLVEANAAADAALKSKYGITKEELDNLSSQLPEVQGYKKEDVIKIIDARDAILNSINPLSPQYSTKEPTAKEKEIFKAYEDLVKNVKNPEVLEAFRGANKDIKNYSKLYSNEVANVLEAKSKVQAQGVSTTDFGGTPEQNEAWQKDLQGIFGAVAQVEEFQVYTPLRSQPITLKAAINEAAKAKGLDPDTLEVTQSGKVFRTMQPMPDGNFHWQVDYVVKDPDSKETTTLKVLFPSDAGLAISSSFYDALDNSPEARAVEALLYAKNFNLNEFKIPGTEMTIKGSGNNVMLDIPGSPVYNKTVVTWQEAKNILTEKYQIEELARANPRMSQQEVERLYEYYKTLSIPTPTPLTEEVVTEDTVPTEE